MNAENASREKASYEAGIMAGTVWAFRLVNDVLVTNGPIGISEHLRLAADNCEQSAIFRLKELGFSEAQARTFLTAAFHDIKTYFETHVAKTN